jgi:hypothetical protein
LDLRSAGGRLSDHAQLADHLLVAQIRSSGASLAGQRLGTTLFNVPSWPAARRWWVDDETRLVRLLDADHDRRPRSVVVG